MCRLLWIVPMLGLLAAAGCGNKADEYQKAVEVYQAERVELDRLNKEKVEYNQKGTDFINEFGYDLSNISTEANKQAKQFFARLEKIDKAIQLDIDTQRIVVKRTQQRRDSLRPK